MADEDTMPKLTDEQQEPQNDEDSFADKSSSSGDSNSDDSSSDSESDSDESSEGDSESGENDDDADAELEEKNTPEANIKRFLRIINSKKSKKRDEEEDNNIKWHEDLFDFPEDPENWTEEDLKELWADAPYEMTKPGWDPSRVDEEEVDVIRNEIKAGRKPPIAPFYLPYRKYYPVIPDNHHDISTPKEVIEELDRIEEFLKWVSYIFPDGSSYEGTVWDDLAHGKGVYVAEQGLVRYEGEWLQNNMEGHGVVEVEIPDIEPEPGSKQEEQLRAEGKIISRDFMSPEDREWLEKDVEDAMLIGTGTYEIPFYENDEWVRQFGAKPEKGRYRYAGQWKHGRMHGCGVYEVNERSTYGRFYFGQLLEGTYGCDVDISAMHAGIAEVAAAKARMFINKPDGMVREARGPYSDPQHHYFYEEDDVWMAPGFINQFYEVPDYWKMYVHEVDQEREMWLNSFYKAPLRLPMPAELEYWWAKDEKPEFILINKEPEPDPEDPSQLVYTEDPLILHTPTGRIINYVDDEEYGIRLFWQPPLKQGKDVDPDKAEFLPLGFDEFYGKEEEIKEETTWDRLEKACKPFLEKIEKWAEEKKKISEMKVDVIENEHQLAEAELSLKEAIEDMEEELKRMEKEEEKKVEEGLQEEDNITISSEPKKEFEGKKIVDQGKDEKEEEEEDEEDDDDDDSFGSVIKDQDPIKKEQSGNRGAKSPFATSSSSFASCSLFSTVPSKLQHSFLKWKEVKTSPETPRLPCFHQKSSVIPSSLVSFPRTVDQSLALRATRLKQKHYRSNHITKSQLLLKNCSKQKAYVKSEKIMEEHNTLSSILSLHTPIEIISGN